MGKRACGSETNDNFVENLKVWQLFSQHMVFSFLMEI